MSRPGSFAGNKNSRVNEQGRVLYCDARRRFHVQFADGLWWVIPMVPQMVHLQDVVKLHTFVLGHLGALLLACLDLIFALLYWLLIW